MLSVDSNNRTAVNTAKDDAEFSSALASNRMPRQAPNVNAKNMWRRVRGAAKMISRFSDIQADMRMFGTNNVVSQEEYDKMKAVDEAPERWYIIHPSGVLRSKWDIAIILLLVYTMAMVPIHVAFGTFPAVEWDNAYFLFEFTIDVMFIIDIFVNFLSAYWQKGKLITEPGAIAKHYIRTWFLLDLVASFPVYLVDDVGSPNRLTRLARLPRLLRLLRMLRLVRLLRLLRLNRYVDRLQLVFQLNSGAIRAASFFFWFLAVVHITTCMWIFVATTEDSLSDTWIGEAHMENDSYASIYMVACYWSFSTLTSVGYGDVHAVNGSEYGVSIVIMMLGVSFYSFMVSTVSGILTKSYSDESTDSARMESVKVFMRKHQLPKSMQNRIMAHFTYMTKKMRHRSNMNSQQIMDQLSHSLRIEVALHTHKEMLESIPFLEHNDPAFIALILPHMKPLRVPESQFILHQDWHSQEIYFLLKGRAKQVSPDGSLTYRYLVEGSYFGEIPHFVPGMLNPNVKASTSCELLTLSVPVLREALQRFAGVRRYMRTVAFERCRRVTSAIAAEPSNIKQYLNGNSISSGTGADTGGGEGTSPIDGMSMSQIRSFVDQMQAKLQKLSYAQQSQEKQIGELTNTLTEILAREGQVPATHHHHHHHH
jgi:hyperpolarization activated cyclic nucleotide-gated potassium channel 2